jgi:hypothetical protein
MPRSLIDCLVYSHSPNKILNIAYGGNPLLLLDNDFDGYQGRLFLHATKYTSEEDRSIGIEDVKAILSFDRQVPKESIKDNEIPECSMIGWCNVKIEPYNQLLFEEDYFRHNLPYSWEELSDMRGWTPMTTVYGCSMSNFHVCKSPIVGIRKDNIAEMTEIWQPGEPIELEAMKMCLEKDRVKEVPKDFVERIYAYWDSLEE